MRKQYLHLSAYVCDKCQGPVVSGSLAVRENEISKETDIREVGAICLSCGNRQSRATAPERARPLSPLDWGEPGTINPRRLMATVEEVLSHSEAN